MAGKLRSGYTTGACAAAAAKAAALALLNQKEIAEVDVLFPDRSVVRFAVGSSNVENDRAICAVVKDAGDDPDVTNGAIIEAEVRLVRTKNKSAQRISIKGGTGVGVVTKPGLAVKVGLPAINPVPLAMIEENVAQAIAETGKYFPEALEITVHVPDGIELAKKTLNERLGIIGGISILGTTGIVRPVSAEAWTATIKSSMDVAQANGVREIILSTGRTSERCVERLLQPREEALVMMGDYLHFSLQEIRNYPFIRVHVATMWAKLLKGAMGHPQTHVRHGVLDTRDICTFLEENRVAGKIIERIKPSNTAREILDILLQQQAGEVIRFVCDYAAEKYREIAGVPVTVHLVGSNGALLDVD